MRKLHRLYYFFLSTTTLLASNTYAEKIIFNSDSHIGFLQIETNGSNCTGKIYWQININENEKKESVDTISCVVEPSQTEQKAKARDADNQASSQQLVGLHPNSGGDKASYIAGSSKFK